MPRVVVAGGGIAGLTIAFELTRTCGDDVEVLVLERAGRAGGNLRSERVNGYLCEWGPNGFLDNVPETLALVRQLGIEDRLLPADTRAWLSQSSSCLVRFASAFFDFASANCFSREATS